MKMFARVFLVLLSIAAVFLIISGLHFSIALSGVRAAPLIRVLFLFVLPLTMAWRLERKEKFGAAIAMGGVVAAVILLGPRVRQIENNLAYRYENNRPSAPKGFLVPDKDSIPAGFELKRESYSRHGYNIAYEGTQLAINDAHPMISVDSGGSYEEVIKEVGSGDRTFEVLGRKGVLVSKTTSWPGKGDTVVYYAFLNDDGQVLKLTALNFDGTAFPPEKIIGLLSTFKEKR